MACRREDRSRRRQWRRGHSCSADMLSLRRPSCSTMLDCRLRQIFVASFQGSYCRKGHQMLVTVIFESKTLTSVIKSYNNHHISFIMINFVLLSFQMRSPYAIGFSQSSVQLQDNQCMTATEPWCRKDQSSSMTHQTRPEHLTNRARIVVCTSTPPPVPTYHKAEDLVREQLSNLGHQLKVPGEERVPLRHILPITQLPIVGIVVLQDLFSDLMVKLFQLCLHRKNEHKMLVTNTLVIGSCIKKIK